MKVTELPVQEISDLFERPPEEIEQAYLDWHGLRKGRRGSAVPDIKLLASLSNLSTASVSNFLRNKPGSVSEKKADRLARLIDLLGYVPSSAAQSLRGRQTNAIGIVLPLTSVSPDFYLEIVSGIKHEANILGYQHFIFDVTTEEARTDFFGNMPFLGIVDGLIVIGLYIDEARLLIMNRHQLPITTVHNRLTSPPVVANVFSRNERAFQDLIDHHLIRQHGYRRLALVTLGTSNPLKMGDSDREDWSRIGRINAYREALRINQIEFDEKFIFEVTEHSFKEGYRAFDQICQLIDNSSPKEQIEAVVCTSDTLAAAILAAARRRNTQIPVTGFDNLPLAELLDLTTVDQRPKDVGCRAFRQLYYALAYERRKGELPPLSEEGINMQVVLRRSCGCLN